VLCNGFVQFQQRTGVADTTSAKQLILSTQTGLDHWMFSTGEVVVAGDRAAVCISGRPIIRGLQFKAHQGPVAAVAVSPTATLPHAESAGRSDQTVDTTTGSRCR